MVSLSMKLLDQPASNVMSRMASLALYTAISWSEKQRHEGKPLNGVINIQQEDIKQHFRTRFR